MWIDAYAHIYQKINGFKVFVKTESGEKVGYVSLKPSTRSTYDIAMRDATIDGLLTSDDIELIQPGQILYREVQPSELFILQSVNKFEFQINTRNINAIKQNCFITVMRNEYDEETEEDKYSDVYKDIISFITTESKDEKNFGAGIEDNTIISIQIPKRDSENVLYDIHNGDRLMVSNLAGDLDRKIKVESVDEFSIPGVTKLYGSYDARTGE